MILENNEINSNNKKNKFNKKNQVEKNGPGSGELRLVKKRVWIRWACDSQTTKKRGQVGLYQGVNLGFLIVLFIFKEFLIK